MARNAYPSDLTKNPWNEIKPLIPAALPGGRRRSVDLCEVLNGLLYLNRTGCSRRQLPRSSECMILIAMIDLMVYRISPE
ncbi:MAG: transposase [Planctomycetes bacterium]|nr:transposase [Planctomycetota bacterium]